jgi:hypothetical protein
MGQARPLLVLVVVAVFWSALASAQEGEPSVKPAQADALTAEDIAVCLSESYPDGICRVTSTDVEFCDGSQMALVDLAPMFDERYPSAPQVGAPVSDPGRTRHEPFFKKLYGDSAARVRGRLATVVWLPQTVGRRLRVHGRHKVASQLQKVSDALERAPLDTRRTVQSTSGTFAWRKIRGTNRLSMHSFAIAIDVGVPGYADFWKWRRSYRNRIPLSVVEVFEQHGFIWGGKWKHFDTMHFEYRPELLHPRCVR